MKLSQLPPDFQAELGGDYELEDDPDFSVHPLSSILIPGTEIYLMPWSAMDLREAQLFYICNDMETLKDIDCARPAGRHLWVVETFVKSGPNPIIYVRIDRDEWILA